MNIIQRFPYRRHSNNDTTPFCFILLLSSFVEKKKNSHWKYFIGKWNRVREINASNKCSNVLPRFCCIIERRNEIDLKNTTGRRRKGNWKFFDKKKKKKKLLFEIYSIFIRIRANISPPPCMVERELLIDLPRRSFAFDRHPFTSLCKMFRATSTLNDTRSFHNFFFYSNATIIHDKSENFAFQWRSSMDLTKLKQKFLFYNYSVTQLAYLYMFR